MRLLPLILLALASSSVIAGPFADIDFGGTCTREHSQVLENGDALSVLLDDFGVHMPANEKGDGLITLKTCWMRLVINAPAGNYLAGLKQVYRGGLIKSANSMARVVLRYNVGQKLDVEREARMWAPGKAVRPEDAASSFEYTIDDNLADARCGRPAVYAVHLVFTGRRPNLKQDFVLGSLDTADFELKRRIVLQPRWKPCRP